MHPSRRRGGSALPAPCSRQALLPRCPRLGCSTTATPRSAPSPAHASTPRPTTSAGGSRGGDTQWAGCLGAAALWALPRPASSPPLQQRSAVLVPPAVACRRYYDYETTPPPGVLSKAKGAPSLGWRRACPLQAAAAADRLPRRQLVLAVRWADAGCPAPPAGAQTGGRPPPTRWRRRATPSPPTPTTRPWSSPWSSSTARQEALQRSGSLEAGSKSACKQQLGFLHAPVGSHAAHRLPLPCSTARRSPAASSPS